MADIPARWPAVALLLQVAAMAGAVAIAALAGATPVAAAAVAYSGAPTLGRDPPT